jgi:hypothetical protein
VQTADEFSLDKLLRLWYNKNSARNIRWRAAKQNKKTGGII